jgi:histidine triad (HIT) family protein
VETTRTGAGDRRPDCIFCHIVAGQAAASTVLDDADVLAFMDLNPVRPGHVLVIPKAHRAQTWEMHDAEFASVYRHLPTLVRAVKRAMDADAIDVLNLNGPAGGQTVFHVHFHLIPIHRHDSPVRRDGRSVGFAFEQHAAARDELDRLAEQIRQALLDPRSREPEINSS